MKKLTTQTKIKVFIHAMGISTFVALLAVFNYHYHNISVIHAVTGKIQSIKFVDNNTDEWDADYQLKLDTYKGTLGAEIAFLPNSIDDLKAGDEITVEYTDKSQPNIAGLSGRILKIGKDGELFYERGPEIYIYWEILLGFGPVLYIWALITIRKSRAVSYE